VPEPGEFDTARRARLVRALARGATIKAAAEEAGYARPYVQRLMRDDATLKDEIVAARTAAMSPTGEDLEKDAEKLKILEANALAVINRAMRGIDANDPQAKKDAAQARVAVAAAKSALEHVRKVRANALPPKGLPVGQVRVIAGDGWLKRETS
jgi:hypothetical protein